MHCVHIIRQAMQLEQWLLKYGFLPYLRDGGILKPGECLLAPPELLGENGQGDCNVVASHLARLLIQMGVPEDYIRVLLVTIPYWDHEREPGAVQHTMLSVGCEGHAWLCGCTPMDRILLGGDRPVSRHACKAQIRVREQVEPHEFHRRLGAFYPVRHVRMNGHGAQVLAREQPDTTPAVECAPVARRAAPVGTDPANGAVVELRADLVGGVEHGDEVRYDVRCALDELRGGALWCRAGMQLSVQCSVRNLPDLRYWLEHLDAAHLPAAIRATSRLPDCVSGRVHWELRPG